MEGFMEDRIKKYVEYHFRFKRGKEKEDLVEEVSGNLIDYFYQKSEAYGDEDRAYRETIARLGDFSDVNPEAARQFSLMPGIYDVGLITAAVLSAFGLVAVFLHTSIAFILTVLSISMFVASAYYTYHKAQYEKNVNGDIDTFYLYLDKSFSYLKTAFVFWALTFSLLLAGMFANVIMFMNAASNPFEAFDNIGELVLVYFFSFVLAAIIIGIFFYMLYERIMAHYRFISGKEDLEGSFKKGLGMVAFEESSFIVSVKPYAPWVMLVFALISLLAPLSMVLDFGSVYYDSIALIALFNLMQPGTYFIGIVLLVAYGFMGIALIKSIRDEDKKMGLVFISFILGIAAYMVVGFVIDQFVEGSYIMFTSTFNSPFILLVGTMLVGIYLLALKVRGTKEKLD